MTTEREIRTRIDALDRLLAHVEQRIADAGLGKAHAVADTLAEHERRISGLEKRQ